MHLRLGQATRHDAQDQTSRHRSRRCRLHAQSHRLQSRAHSQAHRRLRRSLPASRKTGSDRPKSNNKERKRLGYRGFFSKLLELNAVTDPLRWKIYRVSRPDATDVEIAEFLSAHHCLEQLVALARSLPDTRVVEATTR